MVIYMKLLYCTILRITARLARLPLCLKLTKQIKKNKLKKTKKTTKKQQQQQQQHNSTASDIVPVKTNMLYYLIDKVF